MNEQRSFFPLYQQSAQNPTTQVGQLLPSVTVASNEITATASARISGTDKNNYCQIHIANTTTAWAYVSFGVFGAVVAATVATGYPVPPGMVRIVSVDEEVTGASVILGTTPGTSTGVIFTRGEGV
jgi:hypothetical protein